MNMIPWANLSPEVKWHWFSHFAGLAAERPYTSQWAAKFPLKTVRSHGDLDPNLHGCLSPYEPTTYKRHLDGFSRFLHRLLQSVRILYNGPPLSPSKLPLPMGRSEPQSTTSFLEPIGTHNPNGISNSSAVLHGS